MNTKTMPLQIGAHVIINRYVTGKTGTFGYLHMRAKQSPGPDVCFACATLEPPIDDLIHPAIPEGKYRAIKYPSSKFGVVWLLENTFPRIGILIHWGNWFVHPETKEYQTEGCVILGLRRGKLLNVDALVGSKRIFNSFMKHTESCDFLDIQINNRFEVPIKEGEENVGVSKFKSGAD